MTTLDKIRNKPAAKPSLHKGTLWGHSHLGAPLHPEPLLHDPAPRAPSLDLDAPILPGVGTLSPACASLEALLPPGMSLRGLGSNPGDRRAVHAHWASLDRADIYRRFFSSINDYMLRRRAAETDFVNPRLAGIFDVEGNLACLAEWAWDPAAPGEAEAAFSTASSHRRMGLAKIAAGVCAIDARESGVERLRIDTLRENSAAQALARSLGGTREALMGASASDAVSSYIDLRPGAGRSIESRLGLAER